MDFVKMSLSLENFLVNHLLFEDLLVYLTVQKPEENVGSLKLATMSKANLPNLKIPKMELQKTPVKRKLNSAFSTPIKVCLVFVLRS